MKLCFENWIATYCASLAVAIKSYFWGGKLWTQSYFVETIGNANEEVIRKYVQNQLVEMDKVEKNTKKLDLF